MSAKRFATRHWIAARYRVGSQFALKHCAGHRPDDEEAAARFELAARENGFDEIRSEIEISEREQKIAESFFAREIVARLTGFTNEVLAEFDRLAEEARKVDFNKLTRPDATQSSRGIQSVSRNRAAGADACLNLSVGHQLV